VIVAASETEGSDISGHDLCAVVKGTPRPQHIPVILLIKSAKRADYAKRSGSLLVHRHKPRDTAPDLISPPSFVPPNRSAFKLSERKKKASPFGETLDFVIAMN
jgi:hypothetical protein